MDDLEDTLTCEICHNIFEDPRVLPCSHTFCRVCVQDLLQPSPESAPGSHLRCPSCKARVDIPAAGPQSLPINFALKAVIDKCRQEDWAWAWPGTGTGARTCAAHPRQQLNVYCLQDRQLVCGQCLTIGQHRGHAIDDLQSTYRKGREALEKLLGELTDKSEVSLCAKRLQQNKAQCQRALESDREAVLKYFNELGDALERKKAAALSALDKLNRSISEKYDPLIKDVEKLKLEESELKELHSSVLPVESPLLFLEQLAQLQQRLHALKQKRLPDTEPVEIRPRMKNLINVWSKTETGQVHKLPTPQLQLIRTSRDNANYIPRLEYSPLQRRAAVAMIIYVLLVLWLKEIPPALMPAPLAHLREFVLQLCENSRIYLYNTVQEFCRTSDALRKFCRAFFPTT